MAFRGGSADAFFFSCGFLMAAVLSAGNVAQAATYDDMHSPVDENGADFDE